MTMSRNLAFGLASSVLSALVGLAVVPFYLRYLGIEAYGLVGIYSFAYALFSLFDFGFSPSINREIARGKSEEDMRQARQLLHTLAVVYWWTAAAICVVAAVGAPLLSRVWLTTTHLSQDTTSNSLTLIGLVIAARWPQGLYLGALLGAERMVVVSALTMATTLLSSVGAVVILALVAPTIEAFFVWQGVVGLLNVTLLRVATWRIIGKDPSLRFSTAALKRIWNFSAGMSGIAVVAVILMQVDKVILSSLLTLSNFGEYTLAAAAVSAIYLAVNPVFNVIYPRFSALVAGAAHGQLAVLYRSGTQALAIALFPLCMTLGVFAYDILLGWTGNSRLSHSVAPVLALLAAGTALHSVMYFPYALQLAYGQTRLPLMISAILLIVATPLTAFLAWRYGTIGGAAANVALYTIYLLLGAWMTHRKILPTVGWAWLLRDVCVPFCISLGIGIFGWLLLASVALTGGQKLGLATLLLTTAWIASIGSCRWAPILRFFQTCRDPLRS